MQNYRRENELTANIFIKLVATLTKRRCDNIRNYTLTWISAEYLTKLVLNEYGFNFYDPHIWKADNAYVYKKIPRVTNITELGELVFNIDAKEDKMRLLKMIIKQHFPLRIMKVVLHQFLLPGEELPKYYKGMLEKFILKLRGKDSMTIEKRKFEMQNPDKLYFFTLCNQLVPEDVMSYILQYIEIDYKLLNSLGILSEAFYVVLLRNYRTQLLITSRNLYHIPLVVLRNSRSMLLHLTGFYHEDFKYFHENARSAKRIKILRSRKTVAFFKTRKKYANKIATTFNVAGINRETYKKLFPTSKVPLFYTPI